MITRFVREDRGTSVIEVCILAPLVVLIVMAIAWAGAQRSADADAMATARRAARAAAISADPAAADSAATLAATSSNSTMCSSIVVYLDTSEWDQGWVTAEATCTPTGPAAVVGSGSDIVRVWTEPITHPGLTGR